MSIPSLTVFTGTTPNKATQTKEEFANNVYATHLFYDNTFVSEMNTTIGSLNTEVLKLNNQLVYAKYQGDYSGATTYGVGDSVTYLGDIWYSKIVGNIGNAVVEGVNWTKPKAFVASILETARLINGVSFNGSADINIEGRVGTAIASATTTIVGTAGLGETIHITGTTTITSFGISVAGTRRTLIFNSALTLTHNATSLILPGATNIVTTAGDSIDIICVNGELGYWKCTNYLSALNQLYIGTTAVPLRRTSGSLTLAGLTLTAPVLGVATGTSFNGITGLATSSPLVDSVAAVGVSTKAAREDHVHPLASFEDTRVTATKWNYRTTPADNSWQGIAWNGTVFCAVSNSGAGNRVMTSPDGITWTIRTSAADNQWQGIAWNGTVFCAVARDTTGTLTDLAMTSPDGITWTIRTTPTGLWRGIAWNGTVFCAVAGDSGNGTGGKVMTSPDGITWTSRTPSSTYALRAIAWNGTVFCAVAGYQVANNVMTSPDGITWTARGGSTTSVGLWEGIAWNGTVFCAVGTGSLYKHVMTSPDGITWTIVTLTTAYGTGWKGIAWNGTVFCAVSAAAADTSKRIMTSPDGITWTTIVTGGDCNLSSIAWNGTVFCAVGFTDVGHRAMTTV